MDDIEYMGPKGGEVIENRWDRIGLGWPLMKPKERKCIRPNPYQSSEESVSGERRRRRRFLFRS